MNSGFYSLIRNFNNKISMAELLNSLSYDELGEVDINTLSGKIIYHIEHKYFLPSTHGSFIDLYYFTRDYLVHPEDQATFVALMDPKDILKRLKESNMPNTISAQLRYKLQNGKYRWIEQVVITGEENGLAPGIIRFYIFDIQNKVNRELGEAIEEENLLSTERDTLTRLYTEKVFFKHVQERINEKCDKDYAILTLDIEHFRLFDEWYGREVGNTFIARIGIIISEVESKHNAIGGYFGQDDFVLYLPNKQDVIEKLFNDIRSLVVSFGSSVGFMPAFGVCLVEEMDANTCYDKANLACFYAKNDIKKRIYYYDKAMHNKSEFEYRVVFDFPQAIRNHELTFVLQPQCRIKTKNIVGAESLCRWNRDGKVIPPSEFIPILEKFGFITDLDKYIWEEVCIWLAKMIKEGYNPVPISVNISQVDFYTIDVFTYLVDLIKKYDLTPNLLKIEITESAYVDTQTIVRDVATRLKNYGFTVLMDDFGSGSSSLNMLSNINIDVLKLDARFIQIEGDDSKQLHILESIVNMSKQISIPIVAEGVETEEQMKFLSDLGVRYVQGYYFYKPMAVSDFEELIKNEENVDRRGFILKNNQQFSLQEFLDQSIYSDSMLNNIIGAVCLYSMHGDDIDIIRYNQQFYLEVDVPDFMEKLTSIQNYLYDNDKEKIYELFNEAKNNKLLGSQGILRFLRFDGKYAWVYSHYYYLGVIDGEDRFYGSIENITPIATLEEEIRMISKYSIDTIIFLKGHDNDWNYKIASYSLESIIGINGEEFGKELVSGKFYKRVVRANDKSLINVCLHAFLDKRGFKQEFVMRDKDNNLVSMIIQGNVITDELSPFDYILVLRPKD